MGMNLSISLSWGKRVLSLEGCRNFTSHSRQNLFERIRSSWTPHRLLPKVASKRKAGSRWSIKYNKPHRYPTAGTLPFVLRASYCQQKSSAGNRQGKTRWAPGARKRPSVLALTGLNPWRAEGTDRNFGTFGTINNNRVFWTKLDQSGKKKCLWSSSVQAV